MGPRGTVGSEESVLVQEAIDEITQNIVERGNGTVWIDDWRGRYSHLAPTPKEFMAQHPDRFTMAYNGNRYTVALAGKGKPPSPHGPGVGKGGMIRPPGPPGPMLVRPPGKGGPPMMALPFFQHKGKGKGAAASGEGNEDDAIEEIRGLVAGSPNGRVWIEGWRERYGHLAPSPKQFMETRPHLFTLTFHGNSYTVALNSEEERPTNDVALGGGAEEAIQEIKNLLAHSPDGKVWMGHWRQKYALLAPSPRAFMESRPDVFTVTSRGGGYTVTLVEAEEAAPARESSSKAYGPVDERPADEDAAVAELSELVEQSADGRIWVPEWQRFSHLARTPKAFMESRPDVFAIHHKGKGYTVSLVEAEAPAAPSAGTKRPAQDSDEEVEEPAPVAKERPLPKIARIQDRDEQLQSSALEFIKPDKEEDALAEIFDQLSKPNSNGKVWFSGWGRRFGHLAATPREFIEMHPDKFEVIPGYGGGFTVELR